jgi:hypothetical protein
MLNVVQKYEYLLEHELFEKTEFASRKLSFHFDSSLRGSVWGIFCINVTMALPHPRSNLLALTSL